MPVERAAIKEIADKFLAVKDAADDVTDSAGNMKLFSIEATRKLEKAKEDDVARILPDLLEPVTSSKDYFLKHAKDLESKCKLLEKQIAEFVKAAGAK